MKLLYNLPLPEASQQTESDQLGQQLAELGLLDEDSAAVESLSSQAADLTLEGHISWGEELSSMLAAELDELADANLSALPLYRRGESGADQNQGWYEIQSATVDPVHPNRREAWTYDLSLTFDSRRGSAFRLLAVNPREADHPWGNDITERVALPASAGKVRWFDRETGQTAPAQPVDTRAGEHVDADIYDLQDGVDALDADPRGLVYDVSYPDDVRAGVRVYDTRGYDAKFMNNGEGPRQWQTIHSTEHDLVEPVVVSNGQLRLRLDETSTPYLRAEEWDETAGEWTVIDAVETAGSGTDWMLYDIDLTQIGMHDVRAQLAFEHPSEGLYDLDMSLPYGRDAVLFERPQSATRAVPSGLVDWLDAVAADWLMDVQSTRRVVAREEVRS